MKSKKEICLISGTRAEYGLISNVINEIKNSNYLSMKLIVTGTHLSSEFGLTIKEIQQNDHYIDKKVDILLSGNSKGSINKSIALGIIGFSDAFEELKPDLILILGDRFEILSAAVAAMVLNIPIAHIHGGEVTEGAIDDSIRHSLTKLSHIHFVAAELYKKRVVQLGEDPKRVFNVGGLGLDSIKNLKLLNKTQLESLFDFSFTKKTFLVTLHPETISEYTTNYQIDCVLEALKNFKNLNFIFTLPNADAESNLIKKAIINYCNSSQNSRFYSSLGHINYLSFLKYCDGVIGNSSSGIIEAPFFKKGTINIGNRQKGRLRSKSIIDCEFNSSSITESIKKALSKEFQENLNNVHNNYGGGGASKKIVKIMEDIKLEKINKKTFFDINY